MLRLFHLPSLLALASLLAALTGCGRLDPPEKLGELRVGVREAPSLYQEENDEAGGKIASGFEHDIVAAFAATLGVKPVFVKAADPLELVALLKDGKVHFVASLPVSAPVADMRFGPPLRTARPLIAQHVDAFGPDGVEELAGRRVEAVAGSSQAARLKALPENQRPTVVELADTDDVRLLERVASRQAELATSDSLSFGIAANFFPDLAVAFEFPATLQYAWGFSVADDPALFARAEAFVKHITEDGTLARFTDRHFSHIRRVNAIGIAAFLDKRQSVLPKYRRDFVAAQEVTSIDWRLLAALAYQESQWDPLATSPTGVRGMMMLTEDTADRLRVGNRLDAAQSIRAGARYLADLAEQLPASVNEPDRTWLALAAYNLGMGHLNGARQFAVGLKRDPNSWYEMKKVLPLLARPEYYSRLKSGRARGGEAVIMVENVRTFYEVLLRFEPALKFTLIPAYQSPFKRQ